MKIITSSKEIQDYYNNTDHISQSKLKLLTEGVYKFNSVKEEDLYYEEKEHLIIGSAVDIIITQGKEEFLNKYYVSKITKKPSDTIMSIMNYLFDKKKALWTNEEKLEACNYHNYHSDWKNDTRISKVMEQGEEYMRELKESEGKQIISSEEHNVIREYVDKILYGSYTARLFDDFDNPKKDFYFQFPIYFMVNGLKCKALLDMVVIDHTNHTIQPIDIKTTSYPAISFYKSVRKYRYDIQSSFYTDAIDFYKSQDKKLKDYRILNFQFITVSKQDKHAIIHTCTDNVLAVGRHGLPSYFPSRTDSIYGYLNLLKIYGKHILLKTFEEDLEVIEESGELELDWLK